MRKKYKPRPRCKATGKSIYPTEQSAHKGMMRIYSRDPHCKFGFLHTYECVGCKKWHIGGTSEKYKR